MARVYYRGEKIGFTVSQTVPTDAGFDLEESGRLQMSLLGATTAATIRTTAHVDRDFALHAFEFSSIGTGPIEVRGRIGGCICPSTSRPRAGSAPKSANDRATGAVVEHVAPAGNGGLVPGARHQWSIFDPATLRNSPVTLDVGKRELCAAAPRRSAFKVEMAFGGLRTTSWITDTGEVLREESPLGLITVRESAENARAMAVSGRMRVDLLAASSVVPQGGPPIGEPRDVRRLKLRLTGADLSAADMDGGAQHMVGDVVELLDPQAMQPGPADPAAARYLLPEAFIESDAPEIIAGRGRGPRRRGRASARSG